MTTTVRKGTNRPAATAKRAKAAQRTPLPTKTETAKPAELAAKAPAAPSPSSSRPKPAERSRAKGEEFATVARERGWTVKTSVKGERVEVTATRGKETVKQAWDGGVYDYQFGRHVTPERNVRPRNASAARKILKG